MTRSTILLGYAIFQLIINSNSSKAKQNKKIPELPILVSFGMAYI